MCKACLEVGDKHSAYLLLKLNYSWNRLQTSGRRKHHMLLWHQQDKDSESYNCLVHILPSLLWKLSTKLFMCVMCFSYDLLTWASFLIDYVSCNYMEVWIMSFITDTYIHTHTHTHIYMGHIINFTISQNGYLFIHSMAYLPNMCNLYPLTEPTVSVHG
jgi:hypothetical protein